MRDFAWLIALSAICIMASKEREKAILEVVLYESTEHGDYKTYTYSLSGQFSAAGPAISAEGDIVQIHPLGLCNRNDEDQLYEYGWVGVVKLEEPHLEPDPCMSVYQKAKRAIQRGATAVVFDVTDDPMAGQQLNQANLHSLDRPVVIIRDFEASRLMQIVNTQKVARARIVYSSQETMVTKGQNKEYFEMGIFVAVFIIFCIICIIVILKLKWRHRHRQVSIPELAKRAVAKLETRKYKLTVTETKVSPSMTPPPDYYSQSSMYESCAICLEEYRDGQELRVLPCSHEFHRSCVDPWLISNCTCPLCLFNIIAHQETPASVRPPRVIVPGLRGETGSVLARGTRGLPGSGSDGSVSRFSHIPDSEYHSIHLMRTCPSCEGTVASSHSPESARSFFRDYAPVPGSKPAKLKSSSCGNYENVTPQRLGQGSSLAKSCTDNSIHSVFQNSGISNCYNASTSADSWRYSNKAGQCNPVIVGHTLVYVPRSSSCGASWESDPEYVFAPAMDKQVVIKPRHDARNGSTSDSSLDCDCCARLNSDVTLNISNQSTCGSVDRVLTDVSSYDSNVYRCRTPDNAQISQEDSAKRSAPPKLPAVRLKPTCLRTSSIVHHSMGDNPVLSQSSAGDNSCTSHNRLSFCSSVSDSVNNWRGHIAPLGPDCPKGMCDLCNSPGTSQVSLGADSSISAVLSDIGGNVLDCSHDDGQCCQLSTNSVPCSCGIVGNQSTGSLNSCNSDRSWSKQRLSGLVRTACDSATLPSKPSVIKPKTGSFLPPAVPNTAGPSGQNTLQTSIQLGNKLIPCQPCVNQTEQIPAKPLAKGNNPYSRGSNSPRQSMVLFTEQEGSVTLPLEEAEKYDPVNGV